MKKKIIRPWIDPDEGVTVQFMDAEVLPLEEILHPQTILPYEMNWNLLTVHHGALCRLRIEIKTGNKMVKYLPAIEVEDGFVAIGKGYEGIGRSSVL